MYERPRTSLLPAPWSTLIPTKRRFKRLGLDHCKHEQAARPKQPHRFPGRYAIFSAKVMFAAER